MKPADNPDINYKAVVQKGYDSCAKDYDQARRTEANLELDLIIRRLEQGARVLDIGCGAGVPITKTLAERSSVTGVDISSEMIRRARINVPEASFIHGDIMTMKFPPEEFNAVCSFYAVFHLPREEHPELFKRIHEWLKPGGYLLATVAVFNEAPYTEDDFFGVTMYWSNYSLDEYEEILTEIGFRSLETTTVGHGYNEANQTREERHPLVFARKQ